MNKLLMVVSMALMLVGCGSLISKPEVVTKTQYVGVEPSMIANCYVTPPPAKKAYVAPSATVVSKSLSDYTAKVNGDKELVAKYIGQMLADMDAREAIMTDYSIKLLGDLDTCNVRLTQVRSANDQKLKVLNTPDPGQ